MTNVLDLARTKGDLKKVASTNGGEYAGACPSCGGTDRFRVWPDQKDGGSYWCRSCGKSGDNIQFLRDFDQMTFKQACDAVGRDIKSAAYHTPQMPGAGRVPVKDQAAPAPDPAPSATQSDTWRTKAAVFTTWAHKKLRRNAQRMKWLHERGINVETIRTAYLGWNPGKGGKDLWRHRSSWGLADEIKPDGKPKRLWLPRGLVIPNPPTPDPTRIRIRRSDDRLRYYVIPGSDMTPMILRGQESGAGGREPFAAVIVESELDAILIHQEAGALVTAVAMGNAQAKPKGALLDQLKGAAHILIALDYDTAGNSARLFWESNFSQAVHWPPAVGKDPGEMHTAGISIKAWISEGLPDAFFIGPSLLGIERGCSASQGPEEQGSEVRDPGPEKKSVGCQESGGGPDPVTQLHGLLKSSPVVIVNAPDRIKIREPRKWARENWQQSKQISELVFLKPDVFDFIRAHPDELITHKNLMRAILE